MENLKVRVKSAVEVKQAHTLGFGIGYTKPFGDFGLADGWVCFDSKDKHILDVCINQAGDELKEFKEITLHELEKMTRSENNYKIKVNNKTESKEVQELFFELGYKWHDTKCQTIMRYSQPVYYSSFYDGEMACDIMDVNPHHKEITLLQLRDMVVLKRNDVNDATHTDQDDWKWYIGEDSYVWGAGNSEQIQRWDKASLDHVDLKPISEQKMASHNIEQQALKANPKLFLDPKQDHMEIEWDGTTLKGDDWVEVPDGAHTLTKASNTLLFWSECEGMCFNPKYEGSFRKSSHGSIANYMKDQTHTMHKHILWQRTQDEPFLTPESVVASTRGLAHDWVNKSASGSIHGTINPKPDLSPQEDALVGVDATLAERQSQYGSFVHVANTTGRLFAEIKNGKNAHMLPYAHEEALHMICSKIARIVNGDCNHKDSWHDIAGYAKLIEDLL